MCVLIKGCNRHSTFSPPHKEALGSIFTGADICYGWRLRHTIFFLNFHRVYAKKRSKDDSDNFDHELFIEPVRERAQDAL